ncbi:hypothetical protein KC345_g50 [Hortaea werneckii]|nr:hypothetical protein KC345_g50 [Hortaea werneckii]
MLNSIYRDGDKRAGGGKTSGKTSNMMAAKRWDLDIQCSGTNFNVIELSQDGLVPLPYLLYTTSALLYLTRRYIVVNEACEERSTALSPNAQMSGLESAMVRLQNQVAADRNAEDIGTHFTRLKTISMFLMFCPSIAVATSSRQLTKMQSSRSYAYKKQR